MHAKHHSRTAGYSLLEMAIVLLIIALLAVTLVISRSLLQQATRRAVAAEMDKFVKSTHMFVDRYGQMPGDFSSAVTNWGADAGCPGTAFNTIPKVATCNGDGNGTVGTYNGTTFSNTYEWYRAWQHMANAGLIDGQYAGVGGNVASEQLLGNSIPASRYTGGGYTLLFRYNSALGPEDFAWRGMHVLEFGAVDSACNGGGSTASCITHGALLTPQEALEIDEKIDDGRPGTGIILSRPSTSTLNPGCTTTTNANTSLYNVAGTGNVCALIINTQL